MRHQKFIQTVGGRSIMTVDIKQSRQTLNLTQSALAQKLGVSVRSVKYWEAGERNPSKPVLIILAQLIKAAEGKGE